jgi:glucose-1-phosphate adenylyltransferase
MDKTIIILAGGASSRMKKSFDSSTLDSAIASQARTMAKAMLGVGPGSRPFLDYLLKNVEKSGYEDVIVVVGEGDDSIRTYYEDKKKAAQFPTLSFSFVVQRIPPDRSKPLGTADAVLQALEAEPRLKHRRFTVCNSDNVYSPKALRLLLEDTHPNAMIDYDRRTLQFAEDRVAQFAIIKRDSKGYLEDIVEKPTAKQMKESTDGEGRVGVSMNIWRFSCDDIQPFLEIVPLHSTRQEKELPSAVKMMVTKVPQSVCTIPLSEHVIDLTSQSDIAAVSHYLENEFSMFSEG